MGILAPVRHSTRIIWPRLVGTTLTVINSQSPRTQRTRKNSRSFSQPFLSGLEIKSLLKRTIVLGKTTTRLLPARHSKSQRRVKMRAYLSWLTNPMCVSLSNRSFPTLRSSTWKSICRFSSKKCWFVGRVKSPNKAWQWNRCGHVTMTAWNR